MKKLIFSILLIPIIGFSQVELKGKVKDTLGPISFANVVLTNDANEIVTGAVTDENGQFVINTSKGSYNLSVAFLGYATFEKSINITNDLTLNDIILKSTEDNLDEVVLVAKKRIIERKVDRLVFNVENSISASGGDALDVLRISPAITVEGDQIAMIGKSSMRVLLDDRIIQLSNDELISFLATIPADDIKSIEVITNPPAKYEAEGNSGLINIVFKKGTRNSWSNSTTASYTQAIFPKYVLRNNFNYQKNKVKLLVSVNGTKGSTDVQQNSEVFYTSGTWENRLNQKWNNEDLSGRFMLDYDLSENSTVGIQYLGSISNPDIDDRGTSNIFNTSNTLDSLLVNNGFSDSDNSNHSLNAHFKTTLDTLGRNFSVDLDYFQYNAEENRDIQTESLSANNEFLNLFFANQINTDQQVENFSARVDVEHPLNFLNLSYGARVSFIKNNYETANFNTITGSPVFNPLQSNKFEYDENIQALYISGTKSFGEKWATQLGLRLENTQTEGFSETLNQTSENDYLRLFPTFYVSYNMNDYNSFSLNYGKRINRPGYSRLNPARYFANSNSSSEGNPFLQPSFSDNIEFTHVFKGKLTSSLFLSIESDGFGVVPSVIDETNQQVITYENFYTGYSYGLFESYLFNKISWWESQNSVFLINNEFSFFNDDVNAEIQNGLRFYAATNNTFVLNKAKTIRAQVNFWYSSPYKENLFDFSDSYSLDVALKFDMLNRDLQLSLGGYDILNSSPKTLTSVINNVQQNYISFPSNRYFRTSLTYRFGNKKVNVRQRGFGNEEEKSRTGN